MKLGELKGIDSNPQQDSSRRAGDRRIRGVSRMTAVLLAASLALPGCSTKGETTHFSDYEQAKTTLEKLSEDHGSELFNDDDRTTKAIEGALNGAAPLVAQHTAETVDAIASKFQGVTAIIDKGPNQQELRISSGSHDDDTEYTSVTIAPSSGEYEFVREVVVYRTDEGVSIQFTNGDKGLNSVDTFEISSAGEMSASSVIDVDGNGHFTDDGDVGSAVAFEGGFGHYDSPGYDVRYLTQQIEALDEFLAQAQYAATSQISQQ